MGRKRKRWERGQVLVEFAICSLAFFLFVFGLFDMARLFESWMSVQHAAREGARYAVTGLDTCGSISGGYTVSGHRGDCIIATVKNATTGMLGGGINGTDVTITCAKAVYANGAWGAMGTPGACSNDYSTSGQQCDSIQVKVTYTHKFITPLLTVLKPSGVPLGGVQRMNNEPFATCT